jgi:hypothetical protein
MDRENKTCFEPVLHGGMDNLYQYHPNATILFVTRDVEEWVSSVNRWAGLGNRLKKTCQGPGYFTQWQGRRKTDDDLRNLYLDHADMVQSFVKAHPSLTYIEVELESNDTGAILEERTGISRQCWGPSNININIPK